MRQRLYENSRNITKEKNDARKKALQIETRAGDEVYPFKEKASN